MRLWTALTQNVAETRPDHEDPRLRGRAYAVPFADVWTAALETAESLPRWTITERDPRAGRIAAESSTRTMKFVDDVSIRLGLDDEGRTRVDLRSASRVGRGDLGTNARRVARFLHALDRRLPGGARSTR